MGPLENWGPISRLKNQFSVIALIAACSVSAWGKEYPLCNSFKIEASEKIEFSKNERLLLCGDENVVEWQNAPKSQVLFHLKTFLEQRGYFDFKVEQRGKETIVHVAKQTFVKTWKVHHLPEGIDPSRFRHIEGEPLTPKLLDGITERLTHRLQNEGAGCPVVKTEALSTTGDVWTKVANVNSQPLYVVEPEAIKGLNSNIFRRYDAFVIGETYNRDLLLLTEQRVVAEGLLQNSHFDTYCDGQGVRAIQKNIAGSPRLFVIGFGINTERGPQAKASWKHVRLGSLGSSIEFSLVTSLKTQEFLSISDWYFSESLNRFHFRPSIGAKHENENTFERYSVDLSLTPATSWDGQVVGLRALFGPSINIIKTVRGESAKDSVFVAWKGSFKMTEHLFELYRTSPRSGFEAHLDFQSALEGFFSSVSATRIDVKITQLWNLFHFDPPLLVFGIRLGGGTTLTPEQTGPQTKLPSPFLHFLGGSTDLRGFSRLELPGPEGALTTAFGSVELRLTDTLPWGLQPFAFNDLGLLGQSPLELQSLLYMSPGFGLRWDSPIGAFRASLARGLVYEDGNVRSAQWTPYISYGEEF